MSEVFGAYGKIPSMGDFMRVGLSASFIKVWDGWMQERVIEAQQMMGQNWQQSYFSAPIWRFTLPPQHTGVAAMSGIIMASVDRVGRQYPLTFITAHPPDRLALRHFANRRVFERLETLALTVLDHDLGKDELSAALAAEHMIPVADMHAHGPTYSGPIQPEALLAAEAIERDLGHRAIWSTTMEGNSRMMMCSALPNTQEFLALFDLNASVWRQTSMAQTV